jgi:hypothetical protein
VGKIGLFSEKFRKNKNRKKYSQNKSFSNLRKSKNQNSERFNSAKIWDPKINNFREQLNFENFRKTSKV